MIDRSALDELGYVVTPFASTSELDALTTRFAEIGLDPSTPFYATSAHATRALATAVDLDLKALLQPRVDQLFPGYQIFLAAFISKGHVEPHHVGLHRDWTYVDERRHRAYLFWCPLVDVDETNGALHVLPRSHRAAPAIRPSASAGEPLDEVDPDRLVSVPLRAGEAVLYDAALVHGSARNHGRGPRPVAAIATAPYGAMLVHYHRRPDGEVVGYEVDASYFTTEPYGGEPRETPLHCA